MLRSLYLLAAIGVIACTGCELPVSVHPLTDEKTSQIDEKLIGTWQYVAPPDQPIPGDGPPPRYTFGRLAGRERTHELTVPETDTDGRVQLQRVPVYCTKVGELRCMSLVANDREPKEKQVYWIVLYEYKEDDELRLFYLNKELIGPAIEREELKGIVTKSPPDPNAPPAEQVKPKYREIRITAEPAELRAFLAKRGRAAFYIESYGALKRVNEK